LLGAAKSENELPRPALPTQGAPTGPFKSDYPDPKYGIAIRIGAPSGAIDGHVQMPVQEFSRR
jgi:hypothetical protein